MFRFCSKTVPERGRRTLRRRSGERSVALQILPPHARHSVVINLTDYPYIIKDAHTRARPLCFLPLFLLFKHAFLFSRFAPVRAPMPSSIVYCLLISNQSTSSHPASLCVRLSRVQKKPTCAPIQCPSTAWNGSPALVQCLPSVEV